ncbi:hypothetical protein F0U62_01395 [Cystobacter fuscus]|uniref:hypothetical protein n=1 Tax=Cystobacter fuscus TaxID=43 RepID=UPI002B317966|nr:hypothetical protein F0U62_01395 [Cystobacter fuscus]
MNTFECRSCKNQFQNRAPICPSGASHTVVLRRAAQPQFLPARNNLAANTPTVKTEGPAADAPLGPGDWTERDRENCTQRWKDACLYHLRANNFRRYTRIIERRDFYSWFYRHSVDQGLKTRWALAASIVATGAYEVAIMSPGLEDLGRMADTVSNELQAMMREGNQVIFDNVFPKLRTLLNLRGMTEQAARDWDMGTLSEEQTLIQPLYQGVSQATRTQLNRIARLQGLPGAVANFSPSAEVDDAPPYVRGGRVPAFAGTALTSIDERWHYGMVLANMFTPGGTGYNPAIHRRPAPSAGYLNGAELARVRIRPHLHRLDAALDGGAFGATWLSREVEAILKRLTPAEQAEILRDRRPDGGGRYSVRLRILNRRTMCSVLATWRSNLEAQMRFLSAHIGGENNGPWYEMEYSDIAPIIRPFSQAEKNRLHTPEWQRIFTLVCDNRTIVGAARDLGLPEPLRTQWISHERRLWP